MMKVAHGSWVLLALALALALAACAEGAMTAGGAGSTAASTASTSGAGAQGGGGGSASSTGGAVASSSSSASSGGDGGGGFGGGTFCQGQPCDANTICPSGQTCGALVTPNFTNICGPVCGTEEDACATLNCPPSMCQAGLTYPYLFCCGCF